MLRDEDGTSAPAQTAANPSPTYQKEPGGDWYIRNGDGSEYRLLDLAPNLEREALKDPVHVARRAQASLVASDDCPWEVPFCPKCGSAEGCERVRAQASQEPVAWQFARHDGKWFNCARAPTPEQVAEKPHVFRPLYASPVSSTQSTTPVMQAAGKAAKVVEGWSDAKQDYAAAVTGTERGGPK